MVDPDSAVLSTTFPGHLSWGTLSDPTTQTKKLRLRGDRTLALVSKWWRPDSSPDLPDCKPGFIIISTCSFSFWVKGANRLKSAKIWCCEVQLACKEDGEAKSWSIRKTAWGKLRSVWALRDHQDFSRQIYARKRTWQFEGAKQARGRGVGAGRALEAVKGPLACRSSGMVSFCRWMEALTFLDWEWFGGRRLVMVRVMI